MSREQEWRRRARADLRAIADRDARLAQRIGVAVLQYAEQELGDVRKLAGSDVYRLRVGDWRVLFSLHEGGRVMLILRILNRSDAYR